MSTIKEKLWEITRDYTSILAKSGVTFPNSPYTVTKWIELVTDLQNKVLSLQKIFSFPKFHDITSFVKYGDSFNENLTLQELDNGRKIEINYENKSFFNLKSQGLFFPVEHYSDHLKVKGLEIYKKPEESWDGNIYGFTDKGNWLSIKIHIDTVSVNKYNKIHANWKPKQKNPSFFKKISLQVKEVSLAEIISNLSVSKYGFKTEPNCEISVSIDVARLIWNELSNYVLKVYQRTEERKNLLENLLREISINESLIK